jgi:hypothetical protein
MPRPSYRVSPGLSHTTVAAMSRPTNWTPAQLGHLVVHLDAADLAAGAVNTWTDRTAHSNDFVAVTDRPPTCDVDELDGQPGVKFRWKTNLATYDGQGLVNTDAGLLGLFSSGANPWTVHTVVRLDALTVDSNENGYYLLWAVMNADQSEYLYVPYAYSGTDNANVEYLTVRKAIDSESAASKVSGTAFPDAIATGIHLLTFRWDGKNIDCYFDGVLWTNITFITQTFNVFANDAMTASEVNLGCWDYGDGTGEPSMATHGAFYIQAEAVSEYDLRELTAYVARRWQ